MQSDAVITSIRATCSCTSLGRCTSLLNGDLMCHAAFPVVCCTAAATEMEQGTWKIQMYYKSLRVTYFQEIIICNYTSCHQLNFPGRLCLPCTRRVFFNQFQDYFINIPSIQIDEISDNQYRQFTLIRNVTQVWVRIRSCVNCLGISQFCVNAHCQSWYT